MSARIARVALEEIRRECARRAPEEACGLLLGDDFRIEEARAAANIAADRKRRFEIDPAALFAAHRAARAGGRRVVGCFHSHPDGPPEPSRIDAESAFEDGWIWIIVSASAERAYRTCVNAPILGRFEPVELIED